MTTRKCTVQPFQAVLVNLRNHTFVLNTGCGEIPERIFMKCVICHTASQCTGVSVTDLLRRIDLSP